MDATVRTSITSPSRKGGNGARTASFHVADLTGAIRNLPISDNASRRAVIDPIRERRPPFSTDDVVIEFAALLKSYGVRDVTGDP